MNYLLNRLSGKAPLSRFDIGDKVKWAGHIGTVISHIRGDKGLMIQVLLVGPKQVVTFHEDGRFLDWHREPSLVFLDRPKKKRIKSDKNI